MSRNKTILVIQNMMIDDRSTIFFCSRKCLYSRCRVFIFPPIQTDLKIVIFKICKCFMYSASQCKTAEVRYRKRKKPHNNTKLHDIVMFELTKISKKDSTRSCSSRWYLSFEVSYVKIGAFTLSEKCFQKKK